MAPKRWYLCPDCGGHRQIPEGEPTRCEINGAGAEMEPISELVAWSFTCAEKIIVELEAQKADAHRYLDEIGIPQEDSDGKFLPVKDRIKALTARHGYS